MTHCNVCLIDINNTKINIANTCIACNYTTCCDKTECIQKELLNRKKYEFLFESDGFDIKTCYNCITKHQDNKFENYKIRRFLNRNKKI